MSHFLLKYFLEHLNLHVIQDRLDSLWMNEMAGGKILRKLSSDGTGGWRGRGGTKV